MAEQDILNILTNFGNDFVVSDPFNYCLRLIGWLIIKGLSWLSNGMESITDKIYSLNDFFNSEGITELIKLFKPVIFVALGLSIVYIGYKLITDREFKGEKIINNITLSVMVIMLLPYLMVSLNEATNYGISAVGGGSVIKSTNANEIIKSNLADLYYMDDKNFKLDDKSVKNNIPLDVIDYIDINEEIDESKAKNKDVFKNEIKTSIDGERKLEKLSNGFLGIGKEHYYRYNFNFWIISISILCSTLVLLLTSLKVARLVYELGFVKVFAIFYAFADIGNGNGIRQILKHILSVFAVIFSTSILLKIYTLFTGFVNNSDINEVGKMIFLISGSIAVIDAPNIVERIFGIDAGLKSAWGLVVGGYSAMKALGGLGKSTSGADNNSTGQGFGDKMVSAGAGVSGMAKGFFGSNGVGNENENTKPLEEQMNEGNSQSPNPLNDDEDSKKSSESVNMADNINSLDEDMNTSKNGLNSNQSENLDRNSNDSSNNNIDSNLDSNDINDNINGSLSQNNSIGEDYGARSSLSEDMETQNISSGNIDNTQGIDNTQSSNMPNRNIEDNASNMKPSPLEDNQANGYNSPIEENMDRNRANISELDASNTPNNAYDSPIDDKANKHNMFDDKSNNSSINKDANNIQQDNNPNLSNNNGNKNINQDTKGNISKDSKPIETRTYGEYARDKFKNSKSVNIANQHYQLGQNTGIKLRQKYDRARGAMREENSKIK